MKNFIKKNYKHTKELLKGHKKVLIAVSTGKDSMALLEYILEIKENLNIEVGVVHINHKFRKESDDEEVFIKRYAENKQIPIYISHFSGEFTENNAREFRYSFFKEIMNNFGYTAILTAHHKDDQAETVMMRIIKGSRLFDLKGIKEKQPFNNGELIRPLLKIKKDELPETFFFEDYTNSENDYLRNRTRNIYIPELSNENKQFSNNLVSLSEEVNDLYKSLNFFIETIDYTNLKEFRKYDKSLQRFFLQHYLEKTPKLQLNKRKLLNVVDYLNKFGEGSEMLSKHFIIKKTKTHFIIEEVN